MIDSCFVMTFSASGSCSVVSREEYDSIVNEYLDGAVLFRERKETDNGNDFGNYSVHRGKNGLLYVCEKRVDSPRFTIFNKSSVESISLNGRLRLISQNEFEEAQRILKSTYKATFQPGSNGDFGRYFLFKNLGAASDCIIEYDRIERITVYARDSIDSERIAGNLHLPK